MKKIIGVLLILPLAVTLIGYLIMAAIETNMAPVLVIGLFYMMAAAGLSILSK